MVKGKIIRNKIVDKFPSRENVFLVEALKHNILSISQLCDQVRESYFNHLYAKLSMVKLIKSCFIVTRKIIFILSVIVIWTIQRLCVFRQ